MGRSAGVRDRTLFIHVLGPPEFSLGKAPLSSFPSRKTLALLVYLAVESSRPHDRRSLAALLWSESPEEKALASLRQSLLALRRILGDERNQTPFLTVDSKAVRFNPSAPHRLDLALFDTPPPKCRILEDPEACAHCARHLEALAEGMRGPFLEGFSLPDCEEFENWAEGVRERSRTQANRVVERLVRFREQEGNLPGAIEVAARGLRIDPFDEGGHRRLMRLMAASGDIRAAELQFELCRNLLVRELGVPPDPETMALLKEIREGPRERETRSVRPGGERECCPVTVFFLDVLYDAGDGEILPSPLRSLLSELPNFVRQRGGLPEKTHGGAFLAWFGLGRQREGAARRAARAALELAERFRREAAVSVRAALHAGLSMTDGDGVPDSSGATGRTAMLLCMKAEAGDLLVTEDVVPLLSGQFRLEPAEAFPSAGLSTRTFRLLGVADPTNVEDVLREPLPVGRNRELELFSRIWTSEEGGVVLLEGPPGIGKSRLIRAFIARVLSKREPCPQDLSVAIRKLDCLPQFSDSPFFPLVRLLGSLIGIPPGQEEKISRDRIGDYVRSLGLPDRNRTVAILGHLLGLPSQSDIPLREPSGALWKEALAGILLSILRIRGRGRFLLVIEDLQWADASTLDILRKALSDPGLLRRIVTVLSVRPGSAPLWVDDIPGVVHLPLPALTPEEGRTMLRLLSEDHPLSRETEEEIVDASGGVPLFLEETFRAFSADSGRGRFLPKTRVPRSLSEILSARLASFPEDRPFLQRAAVIGRVVPVDLFRKVSPEPPELLEAFFGRSFRAGLLHMNRNPSGDFLEFTHALLQEAAVRSLHPEERRRLHRTIGETLRNTFFRQAGGPPPELLAYHFEEAGVIGEASSWYEMAAGRSISRGSFVEAESHVRSAMRLLRGLHDSPGEEEKARVRLLLLQGKIRTEIHGLGTQEVKKVFGEALELSRAAVCPSSESFLAIFGYFRAILASAALDEARMTAGFLSKAADDSRTPDLCRIARFADGCLSFWEGDFPRSREKLSGLPYERSPGVASPVEIQAMETGQQAAGYRSWGLWFEGHFEEARQELGRILKWSEERENPLQGFFLTFACDLFRYTGEEDKVLETAEKILEAAGNTQTKAWVPTGLGFRGWALSKIGRPKEGLSLILKSLPLARKVHRVAENVFLSLLAECYLAMGDRRRAIGTIESALRYSRRTGTRFYDSELLRLRGEAELLCGNVSEAEEEFRKSLEASRSQGALGLGLRTAVSLATLWCERGSSEKVRTLLAPFGDLLRDETARIHEVRRARELLGQEG